MRYFIISILFLFSIHSNGQITIVRDNVFHYGDWASIADVNEAPPGFDPGLAGPNQVWDFSGFVMDTSHHILFLDPSETPFASEYPSSNIVLTRASYLDSAYIYGTLNEFLYQVDGIAGQFEQFEDVLGHLQPPQVSLNFPVNYLDSIDQLCLLEFKIPGDEPQVDSIWFRSWIESHILIDAWGTLTTPLSTYEVLRSKSTFFRTDSVWAKIDGFWELVESDDGVRIEYAFMSDSEPYPVTEIASNGTGTYYGWFSYLLHYGPMPFISENENGLDIQVYPNPMKEELNANWEGIKSGSFVICDMQGKELLQKDFEKTSHIKLITHSLTEGFYLYKLLFTDDSKIITGKLIKQ